MKNAFVKDSLRHVRGTLHRFLSILIITALGVAFFAGLRASGPDMRSTASSYYDTLNFMDVRMLSNMGFNQDDIKAVESVDGISGVMPAYSYDALAQLTDQNMTIRLQSLSEKPNGQNDINRPKLIEGRLPNRRGECLADSQFLLYSGYKVGDTVQIISGTNSPVSDSLKIDRFKIVGTSENPLYISYERGSSSVGSGKTEAYLLIQPDDFNISVYTEIYLTVKNPTYISRFDDSFEDLLEPVKNALENAGKTRSTLRYEEIKSESQKKLDDAKEKIKKGKQQLSDGRKELDDAKTKLKKGQAEYNRSKTEYEKKIADGKKQLEEGYTQYNQGLKSYNEGKAFYDALVAALNAGNTPQSIQTIQTLAKSLDKSNQELAAVLSAYAANPTDPVSAATAQGAAAQFGKTLDQSNQKLKEAKEILDAKSAELNQATLKGKTALEDAKKTLTESQAKLLDGEKEYATKKADADKELADAQMKITDGEKKLAELKTPKWYLLDHNTNIGFASYKQDARRIEALSLVIPLLFFLVAVLVTMTSMTRLVDSDRSYIGTMKAMGYTNAKIALRYLLYAISASVIGSIIGIVSGFNIFPRIIFNAYKILYTLPPIQIGSHPFYTFISMTAAVACAALPAWFACLQSLKEVPAQLMRPEAPRVGKRTVLERITPLWKRLNFTQKIGVRNLFRYKKRMFMTIIGVAGCTALMFTGFGIRDSITTIVGKQYDELRKYDLQIDYTQDPQPKDIKSLQNLLNKNTDIVSSTGLHQATVDAMSGKESVSAFLVVPNEPSSLPDYVNLRNRQTQQPLTLSDNNVVITEKMADLIGVKQGDKITIRDSDVKEVVVTVGSISENYLYHYIYMTPSLYHSVFGTEPSVNQTLCHLKNPGNDANSYLSEDLLEQSAVSAVNFTTDSISIFEKMVEALRYVILVLIGSAAALVFVVLFSLTTINLEERGRELATIKVLGFFNRELAVYIYREIAVLTVFGTAIGLLLGVVLQRYIITTVEVDAVMFSRDLLWQSFAYSAALTFLFALLVDLIMLRHIAKIDMVSSLKSIE